MKSGCVMSNLDELCYVYVVHQMGGGGWGG